MTKNGGPEPPKKRESFVPTIRDHTSYGLNLGWGGPVGYCTGFWGDLLRDMLQI